MDGSDASVSDGSVPLRDVVVNGPTGEDGSKRGGVACLVESSLDSGLACAEPGSENRFHSKSLVGSGGV